MYTELLFHPKNLNEWTPNHDELRALLSFIKPAKCDVYAYVNRLEWNNDDSYERIGSDVTCIDAEEMVVRSNATVKVISMWHSVWSDNVFDELERKEYHQEYSVYTPSYVSIRLGAQTIPNIELDKTLYTLNFSLSISGDGMPNDLEKYENQVFRKSNSVQKMIAFLEELTKSECMLTYYCSY